MEFKDYYQTLGVARDADEKAIKAAFRKLARKYHPDVSKEADAAARMAEVNEAYAVLSDAERRAAYDAVGQGRRQGESFTPPPGWDQGFEFRGAGPGGAQQMDAEAFSEFFSNLFGQRSRAGADAFRQAGAGRSGARFDDAFGGTGGPGSGTPRMRGEDHHARVALSIADAFAGATREITLRSAAFDADGRLVVQPRTLQVKIPKGVREGQMIRLAGQGGPGLNGGPAGDLLLEVAFEPDPRYGVQGSTLTARLPVAPWEAALGAVVPVPLPAGGSLKVRVPPGASSGHVLTVRGRGLPSEPPGDLELVVQIEIPPADDDAAKARYEQMARDWSAFDARAQFARRQASS